MTAETIRKFNDLEFRKTDFIGKEGHYYEIVCWYQMEDAVDSKPYCYTLLQWFCNSEGWDIKFVGDRPFKYIQEELTKSVPLNKFWSFLEFCQAYLDNEFRFEENLRW